MRERSTKRQRELLNWVDTFIKEHGYGPSYREIMRGLNYKSVSTVAIHIDGLISKGYLNKRDNSARSLEVVSSQMLGGVEGATSSVGANNSVKPGGLKEKWLIDAVNQRFDLYNSSPNPTTRDELYVLIGTMKILGLDDAYKAMRSRLSDIR